ncbi:MAG: FliM/FliN family flagellar motor switch protein [Neomegalonema sp.]
MTDEPVLRRKLKREQPKRSDPNAVAPIAMEFEALLRKREREVLGAPVSFDVEMAPPEVPGKGAFNRVLVAAISVGRLREVAFFLIDSATIQKIVGIDMGGDPETSTVERQPSSLDAALCMPLLEEVLGAFEQTLLARSESDKALDMSVDTLTRPDPVPRELEEKPALDLRAQISFKDGSQLGTVRIVIPVSSLNSDLAELLSNDGPVSGKANRAGALDLSGAVAGVPLHLTAVLHSELAKVADFAKWSIGDVIPLETASLSNVALRLESANGPAVLAEGRLGQSQGTKALQLINEDKDVFLAPLAQELKVRGARSA